MTYLFSLDIPISLSVSTPTVFPLALQEPKTISSSRHTTYALWINKKFLQLFKRSVEIILHQSSPPSTNSFWRFEQIVDCFEKRSTSNERITSNDRSRFRGRFLTRTRRLFVCVYFLFLSPVFLVEIISPPNGTNDNGETHLTIVYEMLPEKKNNYNNNARPRITSYTSQQSYAVTTYTNRARRLLASSTLCRVRSILEFGRARTDY